MIRALAAAIGVACLLGGATAVRAQDAEEVELRRALAEAGSSPVDFIRVLEKHLEAHPDSERRAELERAIVKAAVEAKDDKRIAKYGERALAAGEEDLQILHQVTRGLLANGNASDAERALKYARRYEELIRKLDGEQAPSGVGAGEWRDSVDRGIARALVYQASATGLLGKPRDAIALARRAYDVYPSAEAAQTAARWLAETGDNAQAVRYYAEAFAIADERFAASDRAAVRARMGELYKREKSSEDGLGDLVLQAYDRTSALLAERRKKLLALDPNLQAGSLMDFTLSGLNGPGLPLRTLRGKVLVMDFWATWCGPCRVQQPLFEQVKERFKDRPEVVFLSINTDEDRGLVPQFLDKNKWDKKVYFEDGLSAKLRVSSIPTTILVDKEGEVASRMNGFIPERFVDMLSERIEEALDR